jgi:excisionase family DNA binding protein
VDGYTIEEAASVLGVPRERVWELIARGIITATTDLGGAMRVRLRVDPPAEAPAPPVERPPDAGDTSSAGATSSADLSPFRELLTEFRSLTERYGQALLALGEARGEVAGLRSRIDMLEARVDLRLPSAAEPISSSWAANPWPTPRHRVDVPAEAPVDIATDPAPTPADAADAPVAERAQPEAEVVVEHEPHGGHRRRRRRATEEFADALARADDPSPPVLPGAAETAAALAGLRQEAAAQQEADAALPREVPSADAVPVADEVGPAAEPEPESEPVIAAAPEPAVETAANDALAAEPDEEQTSALAAGAAEPASDADELGDHTTSAAAPEASEDPTAEPATLEWPRADAAGRRLDEPAGSAPPPAASVPESWDADEAVAPVAADTDASTDEPVPALLADLDDDQADAGGDKPPREAPAEPRAWGTSSGTDAWDIEEHYSTDIEEPGWISADDVVPTASSAAPAAATPPEAAPVAEQPPRWLRTESEPGSSELSGSRELDEALAALDALAHPTAPVTAPDARDPRGGERPDPFDRGDQDAPRATPPWQRATPPPQLVMRSPASRAYRRLKRIFPT